MILLRTTEMNIFFFSGFANFLSKYPISSHNAVADMNYGGFPLRLKDFLGVLDGEDTGELFDESFRNAMLRPFLCRMTDACCEEYRADFDVPENEPIVLISGIPLYTEQWMYGTGTNGNPNFFLHTDLWESYSERKGLEPLAFELGGVYLGAALKLKPGEIVCC